jgi:ABC-type multidrug transport system ATPase subunit
MQEGGHSAYLIEFKNMSLTLKNGTSVMDGVNGSFKPGRLCAVMGPSGAGKTTIINLVTGKVRSTAGQVCRVCICVFLRVERVFCCFAQVFVNGEQLDGLSKYSKLVGFVPQDDIMIRELTVRDNISFSAFYRLPATMTSQEISARVNSTISELGIPHVQHTIIGNEHTRGISGGQRKRVNIAIELVAAPKVCCVARCWFVE